MKLQQKDSYNKTKKHKQKKTFTTRHSIQHKTVVLNNITDDNHASATKVIKNSYSLSSKKLFWKNIIRTGIGSKTEFISLIIFAMLMALVIVCCTGIVHYLSYQDDYTKTAGNVADANISFSPTSMPNSGDAVYEYRDNVGNYNISDYPPKAGKGNDYQRRDHYPFIVNTNYPYHLARLFGLSDPVGVILHKVTLPTVTPQPTPNVQRIGSNNAPNANLFTYLTSINKYLNKNDKQIMSNPDFVPYSFILQKKPNNFVFNSNQLEIYNVDGGVTQLASSVQIIGTLISMAEHDKVHIQLMPYNERSFENDSITAGSTMENSFRVISMPSYFNVAKPSNTPAIADNNYESYQNANDGNNSVGGPSLGTTIAAFSSQKQYSDSQDFAKWKGSINDQKKENNLIPLDPSSTNAQSLNQWKKYGLISKKFNPSTDTLNEDMFAKLNNNIPPTTDKPQPSYHLSSSEDYNHKHWVAFINTVGTFLNNPKDVLTRWNTHPGNIINTLAHVDENGHVVQSLSSDPLVKKFVGAHSQSTNGLLHKKTTTTNFKPPHNSPNIDPGIKNFNYANFAKLFQPINKPVMVAGRMPRISQEAVINPAFALKNSKEVYPYSMEVLMKDSSDFNTALAKLPSKYKIKMRGVDLLICGEATTPEYMYAQFNPLNLSPNNSNQALVFTYGLFYTGGVGASPYGFSSYSQLMNGLSIKVIAGGKKNRDVFLQHVKELNPILKSAGLSNVGNNSLIYSGASANLINDPSYLYYGRANFLKNLTAGINIVMLVCLIFILGDSLLVILLIINSAMSRDRKKIGILRALGCSNSDLAPPYVFYPFICAIIGVLISLCVFLVFGFISIRFLLNYFNFAQSSESPLAILTTMFAHNIGWTIFGFGFPIAIIIAISLSSSFFWMRKKTIALIRE